MLSYNTQWFSFIELLVLWFHFITGSSGVCGLAKCAAITYNRFWRKMRTYFYNVSLTELEMRVHLCFQPGCGGVHGLWRLEIMATERGARCSPSPAHLRDPGVLLCNAA